MKQEVFGASLELLQKKYGDDPLPHIFSGVGAGVARCVWQEFFGADGVELIS